MKIMRMLKTLVTPRIQGTEPRKTLVVAQQPPVLVVEDDDDSYRNAAYN